MNWSLAFKLLNHKKALAFTLAEVLITMGIIGIVAEMTIPTLMQNFQRQVLISQLKRSYALISQVYPSVVNDNGDPTTWPNITCMNDVAKIFIPYFQTVATDTPAGSDYGTPGGHIMGYPNNNNTMDLTKTTTNYPFYPQLKLKSGETIWFDAPTTPTTGFTCPGSTNGTPFCFMLSIDVNGVSLPNRWGVDIFSFQATKNAILPFESMNTHVDPNDIFCETSPAAGWGWLGNGCGCTNHVLTKGNMDYLKCIDEGQTSYCHHY